LQRKPVTPNTSQNEIITFAFFVSEEFDEVDKRNYVTVNFLKAESVDQPSWSNLCLKYRRWPFSVYTQMARVDEKLTYTTEEQALYSFTFKVNIHGGK